MRRKWAALLAGAFSVVAIATATPAAATGEDLPPPGCDAVRYSLLAGEGVSVNCDYAPFPPYLYRVVAHCVSGSSFWYQYGYWVEQGFGPSSAECQGGLLSVARVAGYHIEER
jgi:hypothetical protein